jgi:hypothetical protein
MAQPMKSTTMSDAFLKALMQWAQRPHDDEQVTIPSGHVSSSELVQVVNALKQTQGDNQ